MKTRGQSAVELIVILSAVLIVLFFIYAISHQQLTESQSQVRVSQARLSVGQIAAAAREVYSEGSGAKRIVTVTIPEGNNPARTGVINESLVNIGLYVEQGASDINELVNFRLVEGGNFPKQPGTYQVTVAAYEGYVMIGDPTYTVLPGTLALQMLGNDSATRTLNVTSYSNTSLNITLNLSWSNPGISTNLNGTSTLTFTLAPNASALVNVNFISTSAGLGTYNGKVNAYGSNFVNQSSFIVLQIVGSQPPPTGNVSYILIDTFSDPGYTAPSSIFDPTETVDVHGTNFTVNSTVSVTFRNSTGSIMHTGSNTSDASGNVTYYWNPGTLSPGTYNVTMNDSTRLNSTTFTIAGCP